MFLKLSFYLFIYFLSSLGLSLVAASRGHYFFSTQHSHYGGLFYYGRLQACRLQQLWQKGSVVAAQGLECGLSSCGTQVQLLHGVWKLPGPKIELMSPTLVGGLLAAVPPRKSSGNFLIRILLIFIEIVNLIILQKNNLDLLQIN